MRLYSEDHKQWFACDAATTTMGSFALLTNKYQSSLLTWMCPTDTGYPTGCLATSHLPAINPFLTKQISYAYAGFGLSEAVQPDTPLMADRTSGDIRSSTPYVGNTQTHKEDGGCVVFADGHVAFQKKFIPPMYNGKNP